MIFWLCSHSVCQPLCTLKAMQSSLLTLIDKLAPMAPVTMPPSLLIGEADKGIKSSIAVSQVSAEHALLVFWRGLVWSKLVAQLSAHAGRSPSLPDSHAVRVLLSRQSCRQSILLLVGRRLISAPGAVCAATATAAAAVTLRAASHVLY
jgi:hypothetical protein